MVLSTRLHSLVFVTNVVALVALVLALREFGVVPGADLSPPYQGFVGWSLIHVAPLAIAALIHFFTGFGRPSGFVARSVTSLATSVTAFAVAAAVFGALSRSF
jgi:lysylphosphatidylglycerol synthetase-like protein (DUF2156 family)